MTEYRDIPLTCFESETDMTDTTSAETTIPETPPAATPPPRREPKKLETELTHLAEFILDRTDGPSVGRHIAAHLGWVAEEHDVWAGNCTTPHFYSDIPCDEYERALSLGVAWMKDHIEQLELRSLDCTC